MTRIARPAFSAQICSQPTYAPAPQPELAMCSTALPDLRLDDAQNLDSRRFDTLAEPGWRAWSPRVVTPKLDRLRHPGGLEAETRVVAAAVVTARENLRALQAPVGEAPFVLLSDEAFRAAVSEMNWPAGQAMFRQPNGVVLINHERAFEGEGAGTKFSAQSLSLLEAALEADLYQLVCRKDTGTTRMLPVRFHLDEGFVSAEESISAFADFVFKSAAATDDILPQLPAPERALLQDFNRLVDLPSRKGPEIGDFSARLMSRVFTYTTVIYANLLSEKINPLLDEPIRVADHIGRLDILFDHPPLPGNAVARAIHNISGTPQQQRPLLVQGVVSDPRGAMMMADADIMHELVHVAANGNLLNDLPTLADETFGALPPLRTTKEICDHLIRSRTYLAEMVPEWMTHRLLVDGHPDAGRTRFIGNHFDQKLIRGGRLNEYKAGYYTTNVSRIAEGDRFIGAILGKPSPANLAERAAKAQALLPRIRTYCDVAVRLITQRGELQ